MVTNSEFCNSELVANKSMFSCVHSIVQVDLLQLRAAFEYTLILKFGISINGPEPRQIGERGNRL